MSERTLEVYKSIAAITGELSKEGISKDRKNQQQGYAFRGIEDVYDALSSKLSAHQVAILPRITDRWAEEGETKNGGRVCYVTVRAEFDVVSAKDGSVHTVATFGEAMDSADKATNKAMSAAYKYMALMAFCIPTEGDNDADATTHEVKPKPWNWKVWCAEIGMSKTAFQDFQAKCSEFKKDPAKIAEQAKGEGVTDAVGLFLFLEGGAK